MGQYKSFRTQKEILASLYEDEKNIRDRIQKQTVVNTTLKTKVQNTNKKLYTFQTPKDFSTDWVPMEIENDGSLVYERQFQLWTFNFSSIDIAVLPYFKIQVLYKEPGATNNLVAPSIVNIQKSFLIRDSFIPNISNVDLVINSFIQITDNTVQLYSKVNVFFNNPYLFT